MKQENRKQGFRSETHLLLEESQSKWSKEYTDDPIAGVSTTTQVKTIRMQSLTHSNSNNKMTQFQKTELDKQRRNQEYLFHVGNHARTVSDIIKFRFEQQKQAQETRPCSQYESKQQQQQSQQKKDQKYTPVSEVSSALIIQRYEKTCLTPLIASACKRSATTAKLQMNDLHSISEQKKGISTTTTQLEYAKGRESQQMYFSSINNSDLKGNNAQILGSTRLQFSPMKQQIYLDELATAGDTKDNILSVSQNSIKSNPLNFTFQDCQAKNKNMYKSVQRNLFDNLEESNSNSYSAKFQNSLGVANNEIDSLLQSNQDKTSSPQQPQIFSQNLLQSAQSNPSNHFQLDLRSDSFKQIAAQINEPTFRSAEKFDKNANKITCNSPILQINDTPSNNKCQIIPNSNNNNNININNSIPSITNSSITLKYTDQFISPKDQLIQQSNQHIPSKDQQIQSKDTINVNPVKKEQNNTHALNYSSAPYPYELNQLNQNKQSTEPKLIDNYVSESNFQYKSKFDYNTNTNQPNSTGLIDLHLPLSIDRNFTIKLTKVQKNSQILSEYQLKKQTTQQEETPSSSSLSNQNLLIRFVEQKKQQYLNDDFSDCSKTPQTNKSEIVKRIKASEVFGQSNLIRRDSNKYINFQDNINKQENQLKKSGINRQSNDGNFIQQGEQNNKGQSDNQPRSQRINNFVRKSQEQAKSSLHEQNTNEMSAQEKKIDQLQTQSSKHNLFDTLEYQIFLQQRKNNISPHSIPLSNSNGEEATYSFQNNMKIQQNQSNYLGKNQLEPRSSLSLIKTILDKTEANNINQNKEQANITQKEGQSPKCLQLGQILQKYKSIKDDEDNHIQNYKCSSQSPIEVRTSITNHNPQHSRYLSMTQISKQQGDNLTYPYQTSLTPQESNKLNRIINEINIKQQMTNSQYKGQQSSTNTVALSTKLSQHYTQQDSQIYDLQHNTFKQIDNPTNSQQFTKQSLLGLNQFDPQTNNPIYDSTLVKSTLESSTNQSQPKGVESIQSFNQIHHISPNNQSYNQYSSNQLNDRNQISENSYNFTKQLSFQKLNEQQQQQQYEQQLNDENKFKNEHCLERKIIQGDTSYDKLIKEEQNKTIDSENRDEMSFHQKGIEHRKQESISHAHDISHLLCQTPMQNGNHVRFMSGNMENLTLNNSIQSLPLDQQTQAAATATTAATSTFSLSNSNLKVQNEQSSKQDQVHIVQTINQQQNDYQVEPLQQNKELSSAEQTQINPNTATKESNELQNNTPSRGKIGEQNREKQSQDINFEGVCIQEQGDKQNNQQEEEEVEECVIECNLEKNGEEIRFESEYKHNIGQCEENMNEWQENIGEGQKNMNEEQTITSLFQSPILAKEQKGYFRSAEQFYSQYKENEDTGKNQTGIMMRQSQDEDVNLQTQDTLRVTPNNPLHVRFNNSNQFFNILSNQSNLGFYQYEGINIEGKKMRDDCQQTDTISFKNASVQTNDQSISKRNSIFDECTKLFSSRMKFIEPEIKDNEYKMLNNSYQSSQINQRDLNRDDSFSVREQNQLEGFQSKQIMKASDFKSQQNSSQNNQQTQLANNSQKGGSEIDQAALKYQQQNIYNKIFEEDELPIVGYPQESNQLPQFKPIKNSNEDMNKKDLTYSAQCNEKERNAIEKQIQNILSNKSRKASKNKNKQQPNQINSQQKNDLSKNKKESDYISASQNKNIAFNDKIQQRKMYASNQKSNKKNEGDSQSERVFERLYAKKSNTQTQNVVQRNQEKSRSKGRNVSGNKQNGEMNFVKINKQNIPYMMKNKLNDRYMLFKKAVEYNLENIVQDQKTHQIQSIAIEDDNAFQQDQLQQIFQKSLINRIQKNLVSCDTMTIFNKSKYTPSYNP